MKKKRLGVVGMVILLAVLAACAPAATPAPPAPAAPAAPPSSPAITLEQAAWVKVVEAAKKEGRLTIYSFQFAADIARKLTDEFGNKYGIRLEILPGSSRIAVEKIKVEHRMNQPIADILQSSTPSATELTASGLSASVWKELPVLSDMGAFAFDPRFSPGGEILYIDQDFSGLPANPRLVKPQDEPKSLQDLLDPKWKGKLLSPDPRTAQAGVIFYSMRYFKAVDMDYFRRLARQDLVIWSGDAKEGYKMVARGEYPLFLTGASSSVAPIIKEGAPLKFLTLEDGTIAWGMVIQMVKTPPHPNAARLFLNWILSQEGQLAYAQSAGVTPIRKDVPDFLVEGARVQPKKVFKRSWESELQTVEEIRGGLMDQVFGKK